MSELTIFGDESGTMPAEDGDPPFCAATLATVNEPPKLSQRSGHRRDVLQACVEWNSVPQVVGICPRPGYGERLRSKTSKMSTMARASRLMTGSHAYLPDQGYNPRNLVWVRCMSLCLVRAVLRATDTQTIENVRVVLDRKTFTGPERALFTDRIRSQSQDIFSDGSHRYDVTLVWSDESGSCRIRGRLVSRASPESFGKIGS